MNAEPAKTSVALAATARPRPAAPRTFPTARLNARINAALFVIAGAAATGGLLDRRRGEAVLARRRQASAEGRHGSCWVQPMVDIEPGAYLEGDDVADRRRHGKDVAPCLR
jgi:hypothetical protein